SRRKRSWRESSRLRPMCARDLALVGRDEGAVPHDIGSFDHEAVDAVWRREDETRDDVLGAAEFEPVRPPNREIRPLAWLRRAGPAPPTPRRSPARAEAHRLAGCQRGRATAPARYEQRLLHLEHEVAPLVRGGPVDSQADAHPRVQVLAHRRDAGAEAEV